MASFRRCHFLSSDEGKNGHSVHSGFFLEDAGTLVRGRSGCEHVVDKNDRISSQLIEGAFLDFEGSAEVGESLFSAEFGLGLSAVFASQSVDEGDSAGFREFTGELVGLVSVTPLMSPPVKWDRDE